MSIVSFLKQYSVNTFNAYLEFVAPVCLLLVMDFAVQTHTRDAEKLGVVWLSYAGTPEDTRDDQYPIREEEANSEAAKARRKAVSLAAAVPETE
jgi:hypothetical protein